MAYLKSEALQQDRAPRPRGIGSGGWVLGILGFMLVTCLALISDRNSKMYDEWPNNLTSLMGNARRRRTCSSLRL